MLTVAKLIDRLKELPPDAIILKGTGRGTLIPPFTGIGAVKVIPVPDTGEWRVPINAKDESQTERQSGVVI